MLRRRVPGVSAMPLLSMNESMPILRPARTGELDVISALLQGAGLPPYDLTVQHLRRFTVLEDRGVIVGAVGLEGDGRSALLRSLAVAPAYRGQGWGQRLVSHAERAARQDSVADLYLLTTTAEPFFAALGYTRIDRDEAPSSLKNLPEFASICPSSAACMKRVLDPVQVSAA